MYTDWYETIKHLPDEKLGTLIRHVYDYVSDGTTLEVTNPLFFVFNPIRIQLDRDGETYDRIREQRSIAGKISANRRKDSQSYNNSVQTDITSPTNVNSVEQRSVSLTDNINDNDNDSVIKRKRRSKEPSFEYRSKTYFKDSLINDLFCEYLDSRVKNKQPVTESVIDRIVEKCKRTFATAALFKQALEDTIEHGWKGIYLKENANLLNETKQKSNTFSDSEPRSWKAGNLNSK
jgi:hypothetical protein